MLESAPIEREPARRQVHDVVIGGRRLDASAGRAWLVRALDEAAIDSRRRLVRQRLLTALNRLISASLDMDDVLKAIAQAAATLMGAAVASFWVADEEIGDAGAARLLERGDGAGPDVPEGPVRAGQRRLG